MAFTLARKWEIFLDGLRHQYVTRYEHIRSCPYLPGNHVSVEKIFVEPHIQCEGIDEEKNDWTSLHSYSDIVRDHGDDRKVRILEAMPGYGKTILCQKIVLDWCNNVGQSPASKVDILLFFKSRYILRSNSLHEAVRRFLLPNLSTLSDKDIKHILKSAKSVVILVDNCEGSPSLMRENVTQVVGMTRADELRNIAEVITTRTSSMVLQYSETVKRLRLTSFDSQMQDKYLMNAVVGDDEVIAHRIKQCLQNETVLVELCEVPLFFATFAHFSYEVLMNNKRFVSVFDFFGKLTECFQNQLTAEEDDSNTPSLSESDHRKLSILAFIGLYDGYPKDGWDTSYLIEQLGQSSLEKYLRIGILCHTSQVDVGQDLQERKVTFYYRVLSEWYAAFYLVGKLTETHEVGYKGDPLDDTGEDILDNLYPQDYQYMLRFACARSPVAAQKIIQHLKIIDDYSTFMVICGLEQVENLENVKESMVEVCSEVVHIGFQDSELTQASTIQLLVVASNYEIPVNGLWLNHTLHSVDQSKDELLLDLGLRIPILSSLEHLWIEQRSKEFTRKETKDIVDFSSKCNSLRKLKFDCALLPRSIDVSCLAVFQTKKVEVLWCPNSSWFVLDLWEGRWRRKDINMLISDEEYDREVRNYRDFYSW